MHVTSIRSVAQASAESVVVGMHAGLEPATGTAAVLRDVGERVPEAFAAAGFTGKAGEVVVLRRTVGVGPATVVVVGLGEELDLEGLRRAAARGRGAVPRTATVATTLARAGLDGAVGAVVEGMALADYRFDSYKSRSEPRGELSLELIAPPAGWKTAAREALVVAEAVSVARDLVNEPSVFKAPLVLAERMAAVAGAAGVAAEIWEGERLAEETLTGIRAVGAGSHRPPCLLRLEHRPPGATRTLALVGKGITFDSGGLSLKSPEGMEKMKSDMAGAAAVVAATAAIARLGLPVAVVAFAALAENVPGGGAQRPGDVLRMRNGKTIEVLNTDAEGRLVLADALVLAAEAEPDLVVDAATLTGACAVALGPKIAGLFGSDRDVVERVAAAAESAGERVWPLPLPDDYRPMIDSDAADMKNTGGRLGGAITAALLLREFVGDVPWAHLDIAGPAFVDTAEHYIPKGATGFGVRTFVELAASLAG